MRLLRTLRLDASDTFIFARAAELGDWAISGSFVFADADVERLAGKELAAFRGGFLGIPSLGWSTLAQVVEIDAAERAAAIEATARCLIERLGAPDLAAARQAAEEEIEFAASLSVHPPGTLIAVHRSSDDGAIRESFRSLRPRGDRGRWRAFSLEAAETEDNGPDESIDLAALARGEGR